MDSIRPLAWALALAFACPLGCTKTPSDKEACEVFLKVEMVDDPADCPRAIAEAKEIAGTNYGKVVDCLGSASGKEAKAACVMRHANPKRLKAGLEEYQAKAKGAEAAGMIGRISSAARMYYEYGDPAAGGLEVGPKELPPSVGPTPAKGACCETGGMCQPEEGRWSGGWENLEFEILDPHYFSYEYERGADGKSFTVSAYGDLDCDGKFSTFRRKSILGADGAFERGELEKIDETE